MKAFLTVLFATSFLVGQAPPRLGWKPLGQQTISLNAAEHKGFRLPKGRLRIGVQAEDAVFIGVVTAQQYEPFRSGKTLLTLGSFRMFHCVNRDLIQGSTDCNVNIDNATLLVRDKRGLITKFGQTTVGTAAILHPGGAAGGSAMVDRATKPNKITVVLFRWACVENCPAENP
jgi:hypothetical protein